MSRHLSRIEVDKQNPDSLPNANETEANLRLSLQANVQPLIIRTCLIGA